ncbi:MAG TPA: hypothetical protein VJS69_06715 [Candidatus Krumholzibacteria bacterium]|nr:hypothetical protein [Candidatus Krumholzibacteria bacterium]
MNRGLFNRNADACEHAKHPHCTCACGGALHGRSHSSSWRVETWAKIEAAREQEPKEEIDEPDLFEPRAH